MDVAHHFKTIWRRRWRILIATVVVTLLVFTWRESRPRVYSAAALISVTPARSSTSQLESPDNVQFLAQTYGELATTRPLVSAAVTLSGLNTPVSTAMTQVSVETTTNPGFIHIAATGSTPARAQSLTDAVAKTLVKTVTDQQSASRDADLKQVTTEIGDVDTELQTLPATSPRRATLQAQYDALVQAEVDAQLRPVDPLQRLCCVVRSGGAGCPGSGGGAIRSLRRVRRTR